MAKYQRVLLKLSGEALAAGSDGIYNEAFLCRVAATVKRCVDAGTSVAVVVGAGNIWRGRQGGEMSRTAADSMGMLATCINAIRLTESFREAGLDAVTMTSVNMEAFAEPYTSYRAREYLDAGKVVVFGGGLGLPYFSTDTAGALRAAEIGADVMLMAKNVDGIYTADPQKDPTAVKLDSISCHDILQKGLKAIDSTAAALCMDAKLPVLVFGLDEPENIYRVIMGEHIGTDITC